MPLVHVRTFRVRNYECDAFGHLNSANYLRLMQETAFDASAAAGYGQKRYAEMNRVWLIRESEIEFFLPVYYNQLLQVSTWIADFRRVSSRRMYEFRLEGEQQLCARGFSDWVFLDSATLQPTSIPDQLAADFFPEGVPEAFPKRAPFINPPKLPRQVFTTRRRVEWQDIDPMEHVNNAVYMAYANEAGFKAIEAFGWPWQRMRSAGFAILLRSCRIQYLQPAVFDEELEIKTWASGVRRSTAVRHYTIHRASDQTLLCQANMTGVWVDLASGQPMRIPDQFLRDFESNISTHH